MPNNDVTLSSTTDSLEQVQAALGIPAAEQVTDAPAPEPETPPSAPGVVSAKVSGPAKPAAAKPAPAAQPAEAAPAAPAADATPAPAAADADEDLDDVDDDDEVDEGDAARRSAAAAELGRRGGKARAKLQARVHELLKERNQARGATAAYEAEVKALRARIAELAAGNGTAASPAAAGTGQPATPDPAADPKPEPKQFKTYEEYSEALSEWKAKQVVSSAIEAALKAERERVAKEQRQTQVNEAVARYREQVVEAQAKYEDYDEVISNPELKTTPLMEETLLDSPIGAEVAYYLGKNPDLCMEIFSMGNTPRAARALGRVEALVESTLKSSKKDKTAAAAPASEGAAPAATLAGVGGAAPAAPAAQRPRAVTKAPDPISPVTTTVATATVSPDKMSFQEYKAWRNAQERARAGYR